VIVFTGTPLVELTGSQWSPPCPSVLHLRRALFGPDELFGP
jgi:hypothetical protein